MQPSPSQEVLLTRKNDSRETSINSEKELLSWAVLAEAKHDQRVIRTGPSWTHFRLIGLGVAALGTVAFTVTGLHACLGGGSAMLRHGSGSMVDVKDLISEISEDQALGNDKIQIACTVSWRAHPEKCWDYSHRLPDHPKPHAGMQLSIWDCAQEPDKFIVPVKGSGPIKVAGEETLCLDSPGGAQLQFWDCAKTKKSHIEFIPNKFGMGTYRLASRPRECVDVPNQDTTNGNRLQMWRCLKEGDEEDMHFSIHAPVSCQWSDWGDWERCSVSGLGNFEACGEYPYSRHRNRSFGVMVMKAETGASLFYPLSKLSHVHGGGKACTGTASQRGNCSANGEHCVPEVEEVSDESRRSSHSNAWDMRRQATAVLLRLACSAVLSIAVSAGCAAV